MTPPETILVVITRRIGDVLLATPLIRSLKLAWPQAHIDALVFRGTEGVLTANPDLRHVLAIEERPTRTAQISLLRRIARRYDLALSLLPGDRPTFYAWIAGKRRFGRLNGGSKNAWKRWLLNGWVQPREDEHTVRGYLALTQPLHIPAVGRLVVSWRDEETTFESFAALRDSNYAVLHPYPKYHYKMWHAQGWIDLGRWLQEQGMQVVFTGGSDVHEVQYVSAIAQALQGSVINLAGKLSLGQTGFLLSRAHVFIGPDTAVTHMAAALGVPMVALFGPSDPVKWGPWPQDFSPEHNPWVRRGSQSVGNVTLLQGTDPRDCVPCLLEGCDRHEQSFSQCLQRLSVDQVRTAVERVLARRGEDRRA